MILSHTLRFRHAPCAPGHTLCGSGTCPVLPAARIDGAEFVMHTHIQIKALQVEQSIVFFPVYRAVLEKGQVFLHHLVDVIDVLLQ